MVDKDYYKILGLNSSASEEEIKKAFFRLAKKYHPDRHRGTKDGNYEIKFAQINEAYNVLKDRKAKTDYDIKFKGYSSKKSRTAQEKYRAEEFYHTAQKALKMKDFNSAIDLLKAATRLEPDRAEYFSALGVALSEKPRRLHEAREMCEKAVEMEPYDVENYIRLGLVYKKANLEMRARKQFERALRWEPEHPIARQELGLSQSSLWMMRMKGFLKSIFGSGK